MQTQLQQLLESVDARPTVAAYAQAARQLASLAEPLRSVRAALLATFTVDPLLPYLQVECARQGFGLDIYLGPFNTVRQELLTRDSGCMRHQPEILFVAQLLGDVCPSLDSDFLSLTSAEVEQHIDRIVSDNVAAIRTFREISPAAVVMNNFALPPHPLLGIYEPMEENSQTCAIRRLNEQLSRSLRSVAGVWVADFDRVCADAGYSTWRSEKMWHLGRAPLAFPALLGLARVQANVLRALIGAQRKCLVLDLDNTLWGGVAGELGVAGIHLGHTYPGNVFHEFQQTLLQFHRRGVLLAINSKNNPADVEEVFQSHPDMVLKREHFACIYANWRDKPANMLDIAKELNIGLDSLVLFDDNPAERALMREALPQVLTLEVPPDPVEYSRFLMRSAVFDKLSFTEDDRRRGTTYREQSERRQLEQSATSLDEFLEGLRMEISIAPVDDYAFPRTLDLIQKTNQFNLTARRHSAGQLQAMLADPACGVFYLRMTDRFGDNGTVGVAIMREKGVTACIDTFLLSCRVIGRTVETSFLCFLTDWARARGLKTIEGEFIPTAKNAPAADFFRRHGFTSDQSEPGAPERWMLALDEVPFQYPPYIQRKGQEEQSLPGLLHTAAG